MDHRHSEKTEEYAELLVKERQHKGMTLDKARDLLLDPNYYGMLTRILCSIQNISSTTHLVNI